MFSKFKLKVGHRKLRKGLKGLQRNRFLYNLETARTIGMMLKVTSEVSFGQVLEFAKRLEQKHLSVSILAYYPGKEVPQTYLLERKVDFFCKKELNWYFKPVQSSVEEFIQKEFDILIDLTMQEVFPLKWIASLSKAKFKVGNLSYYGTPYDMIINLKADNDMEYLIEQMHHYLNLINNRFAQNGNDS